MGNWSRCLRTYWNLCSRSNARERHVLLADERALLLIVALCAALSVVHPYFIIFHFIRQDNNSYVSFQDWHACRGIVFAATTALTFSLLQL